MDDTLYFRIPVIEDGRALLRLHVLPYAGGLALVRKDQTRGRIVITDAEPVAGQGDELDGPSYRLACGSLSVRASRTIVDYLLKHYS